MPPMTSPQPAPESAAPQTEEEIKRLMLVTDAWEPQVNGVVRTLSKTIAELRAMGCEVEIVSPADGYKSVPLITYSEIRLSLNAREDVEERFLAFAPDAVHIATEGTLGWDARAVCLKHKFPFTTSYHTQFPEYVTARFPWIPLWAGYRFMHAFHDKSGRIMVATPTMMELLQRKGFKQITAWSRGVDTELFSPAFLAVSLRAGPKAAGQAAAVEFLLFASVSGFAGAVTQRLCRIRPAWHALLWLLGVIPPSFTRPNGQSTTRCKHPAAGVGCSSPSP